MARARRYIDVNVLDAARDRVEHIYDVFDSVVVMFSGGKDSQVCLHLIKEFHDKWDLGPVEAVFHDREIYSPSALKVVERYREYDWLNLDWYCLPQKTVRVSAGKKFVYVDWDPSREWARPMPEWAISQKDVPHYKLGDSMDNIRMAKYPGKVAMVTGVRADESITRFRSVTQKLNDNYINKIEGDTNVNIMACKPIYDWNTLDVFKYLWDNNIPWADIYDINELAKVNLRVEIPTHPEAIRSFDAIKSTEPEFYERILDIFPDMHTQDRYGADIDNRKLIEPYLKEGFNGVVRYIREKIPDEDAKKEAMLRLKQWKARWENDPENYPIEDILKIVAFKSTDKRLAGRYVNSKAATKGTK